MATTKNKAPRQHRRPKLFFQLLVLILIISIVPLLSLCVIVNNKMEQIIRAELERSYQQVVSQHMLNLNYKLDGYKQLALVLSSNSVVLNVLQQKGDEPGIDRDAMGTRASEDIGQIVSAYRRKEGRNITIYAFNKPTIYGRFFTGSQTVENESWYRLATEASGNSFYYRPSHGNRDIIAVTARVSDSRMESFGEHLGFVKVDIDARAFFEAALGPFGVTQQEESYLLDKDGSTLLCSIDRQSLKMDNPQIISDMLARGEQGATLAYRNGERVLVFARKINIGDVSLVFVYPYGETQRRVEEVTRLVTVATIVCVAAAIALAIGISNYFTRRLHSLVERMEAVAVGDMKVGDTAAGNDEITVVEERFNHMVEQVNRLIQMNYIQKLEQKEAELKALQLQITPHFLYNTLETLSSIGAINHCREVCEISQRLGDMLRYSINNDLSESVPLERELQHVYNYIYIQKLRFKDMFEVVVSVDEELKKAQILRFILQPAVENAIIHGFRDANRRGCIEISAQQMGGSLVLTVSDDGQGIEPEQVAALNEYLNREAVDDQMKYHRSIGIRNVNMRIRLTCGPEYGIKIQSKMGQCTDVIYTLPMRALR